MICVDDRHPNSKTIYDSSESFPSSLCGGSLKSSVVMESPDAEPLEFLVRIFFRYSKEHFEDAVIVVDGFSQFGHERDRPSCGSKAATLEDASDNNYYLSL